MKGIIFTSFGDMVEERYGLATWNLLLNKVNPANKGAYTAGGTYEVQELVALVTALSEHTGIQPAALIEAFGIYMFPILVKKYPLFLEGKTSLKDFLKSIDQIIHVEVHKLYPDAGLPTITYEEPSSSQLVLLYQSPRKLCALAIGLIKGAATYFSSEVKITQPLCLHHGDPHCRLEVSFE